MPPTLEEMREALTAAVPGRMPEQLRDYWVHGEGAAKIRWGVPGDFNRCVRALRKYFPKDPKGLCNRLHTRALGVPPGQEHSLAADADGAYRKIDAETRRRLAEEGKALPDGSFPIETVGDLRNAIEAIGRAKNPAAAKRLIRKRARELDREDLIPDSWAAGTVAHAGPHTDEEVAELESALSYLDEETEQERRLVPTITRWSGLLAPIGKPTGDGRIFDLGSLSNRELPLPLSWQEMSDDGHKRSVIVGRMLGIEHRDDGTYAWGDFLNEGLFPDVTKAKELLRAKVIGPSVDLDDAEYELRGKDGQPYDQGRAIEAMAAGQEPERPMLAVTKGRISGATLVAIPAFAEARPLELEDVPDEEGFLAALEAELEGCDDCVDALSAAGYVGPPHDAFAPRDFGGVTPMTVTDDGRVFGHLAEWGTCHVGFPDACVTPPRSSTDYAYFHTGEVVCDDGSRVPVGRLMLGAKHANLSLGYRATAQHYDETGRVVALVRAWEDDYGIAFAGVLVADLDEQTRAQFAALPLSGDWRRVGGSLELVVGISVPNPGFPVARVTQPGLFREPEQAALVAAGIVHTDRPQGVEGARPALALPAGQRVRLLIDGQEFDATLAAAATLTAASALGPGAEEGLAEKVQRELDRVYGIMDAERTALLEGLSLGGE